ncbi:HCP-like protein [Backusella circina FSU 941]|nr:HCP-like protein [Backusella circina FSU 941]
MNKENKQYELFADYHDLDPNLHALAQQGDPLAQVDIGAAYCLMTNQPGNYETAFYWLNLAGQQKNMKAQFILGDLYALGKGTEKDEFKAYHWYMESAIQGYPKALTRLHNLYHTEKSMYCRGQRNPDEKEWTQPKFKEQNKIRELFEYRVQQMASELTNTEEHFKRLLNDCRKQKTKEAHLILGFLYQHGYGIRKITARAIEFYTLAAEEGSVDAKYNLARIYHTHHNMKWNYREAFKWYTEAAESGSIYAQSGLALLYQKGLGVDIHNSKAIYWYTQAAQKGNVQAQISLGCIYRKGEIVDQDDVQAMAWYRRAAKEGSQVAQNCLDLLATKSITSTIAKAYRLLKKAPFEIHSKKGLASKLRDDVDITTEPAKSKELKKLASNAMKKDANAMLEIGLNYYHGNLFKEDKDTGFRWIHRAAKAGLIKAQCLVAEMLKNGDSIEQDYFKSSVWYTRAAKKRDATARYHLGQMYYQGLGVRRDPLEASRWYTFATEKKNDDAQYQLGLLREKGEGLRQDTHEAVQIYTELAKQRNPEAIYRLAIIYESGNGVKPNFKQALSLYKGAAYLGDLNAQLKLGQLHSDEKGQVFSFEDAFTYYKMAADKGHPEAKYRLAIMYLDGNGVQQEFIQAYNLFHESEELHYEHAENIFQVPIDYNKNLDIDYKKVADMFRLVCKYNIRSLEYNLGYHYEHDITYGYKSSVYKNSMCLDLAKIWYEAATSKNNPKAQYRLGLMYETGKGVSQDQIIALEYYKQSRKNGNSDVLYRLAHMYVNGYGVPQILGKGFDFIIEATHKEPGEALNLLSELYENEKGKIGIDLKTMLDLKARSGDIVIQYQLGILFITAKLPSYDNIKEGIEWLSKASDGGYIDASYQLGMLYEEGIHISQNYQKAIGLYQIAAVKGSENALYRLAQIYHCGSGINHDYRKAFDLYTKAAKYGNQLAELAIKITSVSTWKELKSKIDDNKKFTLGYVNCLKMWEHVANIENPDLQYQLGKAYEENGSHLSLYQAKEWYSKAAKYSHSPSLFRLGRLFELGLGVRQDYERAIKFYNDSAKRDNSDALYALGNIYQKGNGVKSNLSRSFSYYRDAARNGDSDAQFILGTLYEKRDIHHGGFLDAFKWFSIAASQGNEKAHSYLSTFCETDNVNDQFDFKSYRFLSKIIKLERNKNRYERSFLGEVYYRLGWIYYCGFGTPVNYEKAWIHFKASHYKYGKTKAAIFLNVNSEDIDSLTKEDYLKKLEMWESVVHHLKKEELYQLGILYYYGVYEDINSSKSGQIDVIVEPNIRKATEYFKMIIDNKLLDDHQYYGYSSFYLGMIHYVSVTHKKDKEQALYYLYNALLGEYPTVGSLLKSINRNENAAVCTKIVTWHQENQYLGHSPIIFNLGYMYFQGSCLEKNYTKAFEHFKTAADQGHNEAQNHLGHMYEHGYGVKKNIVSAIQWYKKAAEQNHVIAIKNLGDIYFEGQGIEKDYNKALEFYEIAADKGNREAQSSLGSLYYYGNGIERDIVSAIHWFKKAAAQNHIVASYHLGNIHLGGQGVESDYTKALQFYEIAAGQGHSDSQNRLGDMYHQGYGTERDVVSAINWYTKAADQNHATAINNLGNVYFEGQDIEKDYNKALEFYQTAAGLGHSEAQNRLGYMYNHGYGTEKDALLAIKLFKKAADKNHILASYTLGGIYFNGQGIGKDYIKALAYYKIAAEQGHDDAQYHLGHIYAQAYGTEKDIISAIKWYKKAADQDHAIASVSLGDIYFYGRDVRKSYRTALVYFEIAASQGHRIAQFQLGYCYFYGYGGNHDEEKGLKLMEESSDENDFELACLGSIYHSAGPPHQNHSEALRNYRRVLNGSNKSFALRGIGMLYEHGDGVEQNYQEALNYYQKSAAEQNKGAYYNIALLYYYGNGVSKNYATSFEWFTRVVERKVEIGPTYVCVLNEKHHSVLPNSRKPKVYSLEPESYIYGEAHHYLSDMFKNGRGTYADQAKALEHLNIAYTYGSIKEQEFNSKVVRDLFRRGKRKMKKTFS